MRKTLVWSDAVHCMHGTTKHCQIPEAGRRSLSDTSSSEMSVVADLDAEPRQNGHALPVLNAAPEPAVDPDDPIYQVQSHSLCTTC